MKKLLISLFVILTLCLSALAFACTGGGQTPDNDENPGADHKHSYTQTETMATCTEKASVVYACACGDTYTEYVGEPLGHKERALPPVSATCSQVGSIGGVGCDRCNAILQAPQEIEKLPHTEETISAVPATCTEKGATAGVKCSVCEEIITQPEEIEKLPHMEKAILAVPATCTEKGATAGVKCSLCEEVITAPTETDALGHLFENYISDGNATFTSDGTKTATCERDNCQETDTIADEGSMLTFNVSLEASQDESYYIVTGITGSTGVSSILIPATFNQKPVKEIKGNAFKNLSNITDVVIPSSIEVVGEGAFDGCTALNYTPYGNAYYLGNEDNQHLLLIKPLALDTSEVIIHQNCKLIYSKAFNDYTGLSQLTIPASVKFFGTNAFQNSRNISRIDYEGSINQWVQINFANTSANPLYSPLSDKKLYINDNQVTEITISSVEKIGNSAFYGLGSLTKVTISEGVKIVGDSAFGSCSGVEDLYIPTSITHFGVGAFSWFNSDARIHYAGDEDGWAMINFADFSSSPLNKIDRSFYINGSETATSKLTIDSATKINDYAFNNFRVTECVITSQYLTSIGEYAFYFCTKLNKITFNDQLSRIGIGAFQGCSLLSYAYFGPTYNNAYNWNGGTYNLLRQPTEAARLLKNNYSIEWVRS